MDLLRSGRDDVVFPWSRISEDGRGDGVEAVAKKSRPSNESAGFVGDVLIGRTVGAEAGLAAE